MRLKWFLVAAALTCFCQPALAKQDCQRGDAHIVEVGVLVDGQIRWDGDLLTREQVLYKLLDVGNMEHQTRIRMTPNENAPQKSVARFLSDAQRFGVFCVGFAGVTKQD